MPKLWLLEWKGNLFMCVKFVVVLEYLLLWWNSVFITLNFMCVRSSQNRRFPLKSGCQEREDWKGHSGEWMCIKTASARQCYPFLVYFLFLWSTIFPFAQESAKKSYDEIMARITTSTNIADAKDCDLIIEVMVQRFVHWRVGLFGNLFCPFV